MSFLHDPSLTKPEQGQATVANQQFLQDEECKNLISASIKIAAETNMIAQQTAQELEIQSDQIHRIHNDAQETANNLEVTNYLLKGMKNWWSSLGQLLTSPPQPKKLEIVQNSHRNENKTKLDNSPIAVSMSAKSELSQLSLMLDEMKSRAIETGRELKHQNYEEIRNLSELNEKQVDKQRKKLQNLLN